MDITFQSLLLFLIETIVYFVIPSVGKPRLTMQDLTPDGKIAFLSTSMKQLGIYFAVIVVSQIILNVGYLMSKCGGSLDKNIGAAMLYTIFPWTFLFGVLLVVLLFFPGFKSAFSDVIGYFVVAGKANDIFASIMLGSDLNDMIQKSPENEALTKAAEAIVKICGNKSILINQMNPDNFLEIWNTLKPLMTPGSYENTEIQTQLLDLVVLKDNIGEAFWYVYASILISSIVYYNLATRGCVKSLEQIKTEHDEYIQSTEEELQKAEATKTTYKI